LFSVINVSCHHARHSEASALYWLKLLTLRDRKQRRSPKHFIKFALSSWTLYFFDLLAVFGNRLCFMSAARAANIFLLKTHQLKISFAEIST